MSHAILVLVQAFWEVCLFRRGPEDLPASDTLMWSTLAVYALVGLVILSFDFPPQSAIPATLIDAAFLWAGTSLLLHLYGYPLRTRQTITALAGTGAVLSVLALPIIFWMKYDRANDTDIAVPGYLWLLLFGWSVFISARILQRALSSNFSLGMAVAIAFIVVDQWLIDLVLPEAAGS